MNRLSFVNENKTIELKNNDVFLIEKIKDSNLIFNIYSEVKLIFLHDEESSNSNVQFNILKEEASLVAREIAITSKSDNFLKSVDVKHLAKRTKSNYVFFGFAKGNSQIKISVKSRILKGFNQSEAHQIIRILTTDEARATGEPGLLIDDFDVKASHGNSIGQVSQRELYYLQSKGISKDLARWMILEGKIRESLSGIDEDEKQDLVSYLKGKIKDE